MTTQKDSPYIKLFSTLSGVRLYYTKNNDSPVIHRLHVTATTGICVLNVLDFIQAE